MLEEEWSLLIFPFTRSTGLLFPLVATVSVVWVSGVVECFLLSLLVGFTLAGCAALCGCNLPALMEAIKFHPIVLYSGKFLMTYALGYHYFAGLRHIVEWFDCVWLCSSSITTPRSSPGSSFRAAPSGLFGVSLVLLASSLSWSSLLLRIRRSLKNKG